MMILVDDTVLLICQENGARDITLNRLWLPGLKCDAKFISLNVLVTIFSVPTMSRDTFIHVIRTSALIGTSQAI